MSAIGLRKLKRTILIVDDDRTFCESVTDFLASADLEVLSARTGAECLDVCTRLKVDVVLLDQKLPDREGHELCPPILRCNEQTKIIFTTAYPSFDNAVKAVRAGAYDYLSKPFELQELEIAVKRVLRVLDLERLEQFQNFRNDRETEETVLIGGHRGLGEIRKMVELASCADAPVLITGETGSGKNVVARSIHFWGPMRKSPFISVNCSAIPENLIEAELFGCAKGAYTGAVSDKKGIFEMADGGTLFLDEIGEMPMHLQSKLLGVLEDKQIKRLGEDSIRRVDVRVIAATSLDLEDAITRNKFRKDLYYRLSVIKMHIPPLRERRGDIPELCAFLMRQIGRGRRVELPELELQRLMKYDWPGNVRELRNILERAVILQKGPDVRPSCLLADVREVPEPVKETEGRASATLDGVEEAHIKNVLQLNSGNFARTARALGISLTTLKRKLRKYRLLQ